MQAIKLIILSWPLLFFGLFFSDIVIPTGKRSGAEIGVRSCEFASLGGDEREIAGTIRKSRRREDAFDRKRIEIPPGKK
jgi:hypothetical protein